MRTLNVGIVGWGFMGRMHAQAVQSLNVCYEQADFRARVTGVASRRLERAEAAALDLGCSFYTDDYRVLIERKDIDVVSICTPNALHEEMVIAALRAGKHIYIDKPLTTDAESANRIEAAARGAAGKAQMVFHNRFYPSSMRAKALIDEGRIGDVISFQARYLHSGAVDPNKPAGWKQLDGAGVLQDLGSHVLDLLTWLIGDPSEVFCALRSLYPERPTKEGSTKALGDDHALMMLRMPSGALGTVEASKVATGAEDELSLEIYGTRGALKLEPMRQGELLFFDQTIPDAPLGGERGTLHVPTGARYPAPGGEFLPPKNTIGWDRAHIHCYYHFLDCIVNDRAPSPSVFDGARIQRLMEHMYTSNERREWVRTDK